MMVAWAGAALALLAIFALVADGPRSITWRARGYTEAIGPYPGWYYGVPLGIAIVVTVVATELVLRLITLRPAVVGVTTEWDLHLRRRSAGHVTRGIQLVMAVTTAGILISAGWAHLALAMDRYPQGHGDPVVLDPVQRLLGYGLLTWPPPCCSPAS